MQDLWRLSAAEMASLIRSKEVSAKEAATAALARLDAVNPKINAVVDHRPEDVLSQASAIYAAIGRGEDAGPLGGVPVTVKVNIDQQGFATTNGLKLQRDAIAKSNNPVIDNMRKSGAVILGRTNCPAFSYRWFTTNLIHGDTKNPRDPAITPGGSSGGAAAALAAGIGHIAHGTDIAGSIRYPAYACGVHGLRPPVEHLTRLWRGDGDDAQLEAAEREGDPGALACLQGNRSKVFPFDAAAFSRALTRRATLMREWLALFEKYAVLLMPVSAELPFPDQLDRKDAASFARVWQAQLTQIAIPFLGLPGLTVSTGLVGRVPVGVQVVSGRFREDLCLAAGEAIEAGGAPPAPIDPAS